MTNDMTRGNPMKLILAFMIPTLLGNLLQQFYNLADSMVAGRYLGVNALAAIGSTMSLIFLVLGWLNGVTSGFAVLIAQSFGAKDYKRMRHYLAMSIWLCAGLVVIMTAMLLALNEPILRLINTPEEIIGDVARYMAIIYSGMAVTVTYNFLAAVLRALGDGRSPLYFLAISSVINIILDIVLIVNFGMGVEGCGYATVLAQGISALLCFLYMRKKFDILKMNREDAKISLSSMGRLLGLGIPMGIRFAITGVSLIIVQGAVNLFGQVYIAAFTTASKIQNMVTTVFVAFGATVATYVGQNRGAGDIERVRQGVRITQMLIVTWSLVIIGLVWVFGPWMLKLFVDASEVEVLDAGMKYLHLVSWCYPFLGSIFLYRNALQSLGHSFVPMVGAIFELVARILVVMYVIGGVGGYVGVCLTDPTAWLAALLPIVPYYFYRMRILLKNATAG